MVTDLFGITFKDKRVLEKPPLMMPYSNDELAEHSLTSPNDQSRDLWSVGMIILEILIGSELVLDLKTNSHVRDLITGGQSWLGQRLSKLLVGLLFEVRFSVVAEMLDDGIFDSGKRVAKAIAGANQKKRRDPELQKMEA